MRNKKIFSFDEEKDAEDVIRNGFPNGIIDHAKMYLLAKYFRTNFNYGAVRMERELIKFCKGEDKNFNSVIEADSIKKWVKSAMMYDLRKIDSISVSEKEVEFLKSIENLKDRKILFITLVMAKALKQRSTRRKQKDFKTSEHYYIHYSNFLDIVRLAKINNMSEVNLAKLYSKYKSCLTFYNPEKELIRIDFVDLNPEVEMKINNLNNPLEHYDKLFEKRKEIVICPVCGLEMIKNNNKQKNCPDCAKKIRREQKRNWIRNARKNVDQ